MVFDTGRQILPLDVTDPQPGRWVDDRKGARHQTASAVATLSSRSPLTFASQSGVTQAGLRPLSKNRRRPIQRTFLWNSDRSVPVLAVAQLHNTVRTPPGYAASAASVASKVK